MAEFDGHLFHGQAQPISNRYGQHGVHPGSDIGAGGGDWDTARTVEPCCSKRTFTVAPIR